MKILVIVPARSGSVGLKNKNIKVLNNKPLIWWTIRLKKFTSKINYRWILSTDSKKILNIGKKLGIECPFIRPEILSKSKSTVYEVIKHALDFFSRENYYPDLIIWLQPTSPFRHDNLIQDCIKKLKKTGATSLIGVKNLNRSQSTIYQKSNKDSFIKPLLYQEKVNTFRQSDLNNLLTPCGSIYISKTKEFLRFKGFMNHKKMVFVELDKLASVDIDDQFDWEVAQAFSKNLGKKL